MTSDNTPSKARQRQRRPQAARPGNQPARQHPVLTRLAELYPALFGETLRPLKRGIYQDLLAAHGSELDKDGLKAALALHTRSTRYLNAVASGAQRHDLNGQPVEAVAPEHVHHALVEVFRRRQQRSAEDLRPKLLRRLAQAFEASGLSREAYVEKVLGRDEAINTLTLEALAEAGSRAARAEALRRAFAASGMSVEDFAGSYGLPLDEVRRTLA
ncbi:MAG: ProQ/FINO family protein [Hydrogenophaga sp.]|nr:prop effector [Comamonadaceae bacterium]